MSSTQPEPDDDQEAESLYDELLPTWKRMQLAHPASDAKRTRRAGQRRALPHVLSDALQLTATQDPTTQQAVWLACRALKLIEHVEARDLRWLIDAAPAYLVGDLPGREREGLTLDAWRARVNFAAQLAAGAYRSREDTVRTARLLRRCSAEHRVADRHTRDRALHALHAAVLLFVAAAHDLRHVPPRATSPRGLYWELLPDFERAMGDATPRPRGRLRRRSGGGMCANVALALHSIAGLLTLQRPTRDRVDWAVQMVLAVVEEVDGLSLGAIARVGDSQTYIAHRRRGGISLEDWRDQVLLASHRVSDAFEQQVPYTWRCYVRPRRLRERPAATYRMVREFLAVRRRGGCHRPQALLLGAVLLLAASHDLPNVQFAEPVAAGVPE